MTPQEFMDMIGTLEKDPKSNAYCDIWTGHFIDRHAVCIINHEMCPLSHHHIFTIYSAFGKMTCDRFFRDIGAKDDSLCITAYCGNVAVLHLNPHEWSAEIFPPEAVE